MATSSGRIPAWSRDAPAFNRRVRELESESCRSARGNDDSLRRWGKTFWSRSRACAHLTASAGRSRIGGRLNARRPSLAALVTSLSGQPPLLRGRRLSAPHGWPAAIVRGGGGGGGPAALSGRSSPSRCRPRNWSPAGASSPERFVWPPASCSRRRPPSIGPGVEHDWSLARRGRCCRTSPRPERAASSASPRQHVVAARIPRRRRSPGISCPRVPGRWKIAGEAAPTAAAADGDRGGPVRLAIRCAGAPRAAAAP